MQTLRLPGPGVSPGKRQPALPSRPYGHELPPRELPAAARRLPTTPALAGAACRCPPVRAPLLAAGAVALQCRKTICKPWSKMGVADSQECTGRCGLGTAWAVAALRWTGTPGLGAPAAGGLLRLFKPWVWLLLGSAKRSVAWANMALQAPTSSASDEWRRRIKLGACLKPHRRPDQHCWGPAAGAEDSSRQISRCSAQCAIPAHKYALHAATHLHAAACACVRPLAPGCSACTRCFGRQCGCCPRQCQEGIQW